MTMLHMLIRFPPASLFFPFQKQSNIVITA